MPAEKFMPVTQSKHYHLVQASLVNYGISFPGVQQLLQGNMLASSADRLALAQFLQDVLSPGGSRAYDDKDNKKHAQQRSMGF